MKKLPSAKIIALSISAILIVGSAVYIKYISPVARGNDSTLGYEQGASDATKIDPVAQALQNELLKPPTTDTAFSNPSFAVDDNLTARFSKSTFAAYMALQNAGAGDASAESGVVESMVGRASTIGTTDKYNLSNIKTFSGKNPQTLHDYGNAFSKIIQDNMTDIVKNPKKYKDLDAVADVYEKISIDLSSLTAPKDLAAPQLKMANFYYATSQGYRSINHYEDDPLKALLAIKQIKNIDEAETPKLYPVFANYFKDNGILFTKDETGYGWSQ